MPHDTDQIRSSDNKLMDLRLSILKVIAHVWDDDNKGGARRLRNFYINNGPFQDLVVTDNVDFSGRVSNLAIPYEFFAIKFFNGEAKWERTDQSWTKPINETITICLPSPPEEFVVDGVPQPVDGFQKSELLSEHYLNFPNFFGTKHTPGRLSLEVGDDYPVLPQDYDLGVSPDVFYSFGALTSKIMAKAWVDSATRDAIDFDLLGEDKEDPEKLKSYKETVEQCLNDIDPEYNWTNPWAFDLRFVFAAPNQDRYENDEKRNYSALDESDGICRKPFWDSSGNWILQETLNQNPYRNKIIRTLVQLEIPQAPCEEDEVPLALAKYNGIGPKYPFTCS